jgi:DNA-directed RNA polymerase alpha subunit
MKKELYDQIQSQIKSLESKVKESTGRIEQLEIIILQKESQKESIKIGAINMSFRRLHYSRWKYLNSIGIITVDDLISINPKEFSTYRGFGPARIAELFEKLKSIGVCWDEINSKWIINS